ncbi:hypothetical protein JCM11641_005206 [Rhodosporidiobolus odoratus]
MGRKRPCATTAPTNITAFRTAERAWKSPSFDLSLAFDASQIVWEVQGEDGKTRGIWTAGDGTTEECWKVSLGDLADSGMGQSRWKGKDKENERDYAVIVPRIPGLVLFPSILSESLQRELVVETLQNARRPNLTNLDAFYKLPEGGLWKAWSSGRGEEVVPSLLGDGVASSRGNSPNGSGSDQTLAPSRCATPLIRVAKEVSVDAAGERKEITVREMLPKLRWSNVGYHYNWTTKLYEFDRGFIPLPPLVLRCCRDIVRAMPWAAVFNNSHSGEPTQSRNMGTENWTRWNEDYEPDAGIINFYQAKDSLTGHTDHSEKDATRPLVSFSLGHSSVFLVGGITRDVPPLAILLRSGDGLCMSGPGRLAFHGLPRVLAGTLPSFLAADQADEVRGTENWTPYGEYLERGARINVNVRSVF